MQNTFSNVMMMKLRFRLVPHVERAISLAKFPGAPVSVVLYTSKMPVGSCLLMAWIAISSY